MKNDGDVDLVTTSFVTDKIYTQVQAILSANGGNPNMGEEVYKVMEQSGFNNIQLIPVYRTGAPGTPLGECLERTNVNHENLVKATLITPQELEDYHQDWKNKSKLTNAFLTAPPLMITIGEK